MKQRLILLCALFGTGLVACAGNSTAFAPPIAHATAAPTAAAAAHSVSVTFQVLVPAKTAASHRRHPQYISPSTQSLAITINGATSTVNLTPSSPQCETVAAGLECSVAASAPVASDTFGVTSYDQMNGQGNALSTASVTQTITLDTSNVVPLTLDGVIASIVVQFPTTVPACTATTAPVTVEALDADKNIIVGSAPYSEPITLSYADATADSTFSPSNSNSEAEKPGDGGTITYNGKYEPGGTLTATASGVPTATGTFYPTPTVCSEYALPGQQSEEVLLRKYVTLGTNGNVYFTDQNIMSLGEVVTSGATIGTITETPITPPVSTSSVTTTEAINDVLLAPDGNLWITDVHNGVDSFDQTTMLTTNYTNAANPAFAEKIGVGPDKQLWFTDSQHQQVNSISTAGVFGTPVSLPNLQGQYSGVVASQDGTAVWVAESGSYMIAKVPTNGSAITEYPVPNPNGGTFAPNDLASSHDGYIWFTEIDDTNIGRMKESDGSITLFPLPDANAFTYNLALGPDGNMWATYITNGQDFIARITPAGVITKYPILRTGNYATFSICAGPTTTNDMWFDENLNGEERMGYLTI